MSVIERTPKLRQLAPVYGVIVVFVYSWTILWFFWKLNGWLAYLRLDEIFTILMYTLATNFLESLLVLLLPMGLSMLLPAKCFFDQFVARGTALVLPGLSYLVFVAYQFEGREKFNQSLIMRLAIPVFFIVMFLVFASGKWGFVRKAFEEFANRTTIFLYLSIPMSVFSLLIVIARNII